MHTQHSVSLSFVSCQIYTSRIHASFRDVELFFAGLFTYFSVEFFGFPFFSGSCNVSVFILLLLLLFTYSFSEDYFFFVTIFFLDLKNFCNFLSLFFNRMSSQQMMIIEKLPKNNTNSFEMEHHKSTNANVDLDYKCFAL